MTNHSEVFSVSPTTSQIAYLLVGASLAAALPSVAAQDSAHGGGLDYPHLVEYTAVGVSVSDAHLQVQVRALGDDAQLGVHGVITQFFGDLSSKQKPLDAEFAKVLFDNLWDLYDE